MSKVSRRLFHRFSTTIAFIWHQTKKTCWSANSRPKSSKFSSVTKTIWLCETSFIPSRLSSDIFRMTNYSKTTTSRLAKTQTWSHYMDLRRNLTITDLCWLTRIALPTKRKGRSEASVNRSLVVKPIFLGLKEISNKSPTCSSPSEKISTLSSLSYKNKRRSE